MRQNDLKIIIHFLLNRNFCSEHLVGDGGPSSLKRSRLRQTRFDSGRMHSFFIPWQRSAFATENTRCVPCLKCFELSDGAAPRPMLLMRFGWTCACHRPWATVRQHRSSVFGQPSRSRRRSSPACVAYFRKYR